MESHIRQTVQHLLFLLHFWNDDMRLRHQFDAEAHTECLSVRDLQRLVGFDSRPADHERDPDVKLIQLPFAEGQ